MLNYLIHGTFYEHAIFLKLEQYKVSFNSLVFWFACFLQSFSPTYYQLVVLML